jgi:WD40 repeat protein
LEFSPDGKRLASWTQNGNRIRVWDVKSGCLYREFQREADCSFTGALGFSPDGQSLAIGTEGPEDAVELWELASAKLRRRFQGHKREVTALAFSPNGRLLATGSIDTTVLIWEIHGLVAR